jgi:hypothetical protein
MEDDFIGSQGPKRTVVLEEEENEEEDQEEDVEEEFYLPFKFFILYWLNLYTRWFKYDRDKL